MFRIACSIILMIAFAIQTFHKGGIVVSYYLNSDAYAKNCVNKAKPVLKCNGKCQMANKILEQQQKDEQAPERKLENKFQFLWVSDSFANINHQSVGYTIPVETAHPAMIPSVHPQAIFHPPCLI